MVRGFILSPVVCSASLYKFSCCGARGPDGSLGRALANPVHYEDKVFVLCPDGEWATGEESELSSHHHAPQQD